MTFKVSPEFLKEIDREAARQGMQRSELIRAALRYYLYYRATQTPQVHYRKIEVF